MTFDIDITLIKQVENGKDDDGNIQYTEERTEIEAEQRDVGYREFYNGAQSGLRPELKFIVHSFEYDNQKQVEFDGLRYEVLRTYRIDSYYTELTVTVKEGTKNGD